MIIQYLWEIYLSWPIHDPIVLKDYQLFSKARSQLGILAPLLQYLAINHISIYFFQQHQRSLRFLTYIVLWKWIQFIAKRRSLPLLYTSRRYSIQWLQNLSFLHTLDTSPKRREQPFLTKSLDRCAFFACYADLLCSIYFELSTPPPPSPLKKPPFSCKFSR
jgi:hypothetical protein